MKKPIVYLVMSLFVLISCGKNKKEVIQEKKIVKTSVKEISAVIIDSDGVANVLMITNDIMKFNIKKITVKAGQKIKLTLTHTGKLDKKIMGHNVVFLKKGIKLSTFASEAAAARDNDYIPEGTTNIIANTKMIGGGESTTIEFTAPDAGTYDFICSFPAHYAMMKGKLIVE